MTVKTFDEKKLGTLLDKSDPYLRQYIKAIKKSSVKFEELLNVAITKLKQTPFTPFYALLKDGMEIKEGDAFWNSRKCYWAKCDYFNIHNGIMPIRRKLSTLEEREAFWKESKECEE